jgi:antibiotic biosynthesis monooxygenase (ABM) superfamily enzyme
MIPVTTLLKIRYRENRYSECLQWMQETASIASRFHGFLEKEIFISAERPRELMNIFIFADQDSLMVWENSDLKARQAEKAEVFAEEITGKVKLAGLEFMFSKAGKPRRWKMVLITVAVIFLLLNFLVPGLQHIFSLLGLPPIWKSLAGVVVMVSLMTYIILPLISRWLSRWLQH